MRVLVPSRTPLSPFSPPRRTMRGKVCDRRKKWTAAIMEFRATRVVLLPPPQRSLVQRQLCWMNQRERDREEEREREKEGAKKSETAEGREREGAFTTSGLDFFSVLLSRCLPLHFFPSVDVPPPCICKSPRVARLPRCVSMRTLLFLIMCHRC